mgnify:FL=1|tara:strand:+ start:241 stop:1731 length:1491 start_codon:yes stop_codon:yes gene_type:complete
MSTKLFEEAIADAKKLREVAEDNAKKAILEAVTPRIREFIEAQLMESDEEESDKNEIDAEKKDDEETEEDVDVVLDESALKALINLVGGEEILSEFDISSSSKVVQESVEKTLMGLSSSNRKKLQQIANKFNKKADILESRNINNNIDLNQEKTEMSNREKFYEVDLQALKESIQNEMEGMDEMEEELYEEDSAENEADEDVVDLMKEIRLILDLGEDVEMDDLPEMLKGMAEDDLEDEEVEMGEDEDVDLDDEEDEEGEEGEEADADLPDLEGMFDDAGPAEEELNETFEIDPRMLRQELARVKRQLREGKMDHHFGGKGGSKAGVDGSYGGKGKKNAGVKSAFGGGREGQDPFVNPPQINKLNEAIRNLRRTNRAQTEKLNKYRGAINTLREQLEDLNLFNAKLLYVNKLLQNKSLNESQKKSVIKALDEANSLSETKALYKSLTESLSSSRKGTINESVRYGSSSRTTTSASSRKMQETSDLGRWQKLAGLKK